MTPDSPAPDADAADGGPMPFPFPAFTDPERALALLQRCSAELFGEPATLVRCEVIESLYKTYVKPASWPKSTLSVCWGLERVDAAAVALVYARVYLEGRSRTAWQQLVESAGPATPPHATHLPALDMIAWRFPHDPTLRHLPELVLAERLHARLPWGALRPHGIGPADRVRVHARPVRYQPEKSCTIRCELSWPEAGADDAPRTLVVYAKVHGDDRATAAYARQQHFWRTARLRTCEPLAHDDTIGTVWSLGVEGRPLASVIDDTNQAHDLAHYLDQAAAQLWAVHSGDACELRVVDTIDQADLLADCLKKIDKLCRACPPVRAQLEPVAAAAQQLAAHALRNDGRRCVLHGDFHIDQMLAVGADVCLFDFDSFALGESEQDLAEFVVALLALRFEDDLVLAMAATIGGAYASHARRALRADRLRWYALVEFVTRCWRFHREQRPGWSDALRAALTRLPTLEASIAAMACSAPPARR